MLNMKDLKNLKNLDKDDLLDLVGLQTRQSTADWLVPTLTAFGVGLLVGAGVGLLLAPKSGRELREDVRQRIQNAQEGVSSTLSSAAAAVEKPSAPRPL